MKTMRCKMCDGTDLIKSEGLYICQNCGTKYDPVEAKKLIVEIAGSVSVDGVASTSNLLIRAKEFFGKGDYAKAEEYISRILDIDASNEGARKLLADIDAIVNPKVPYPPTATDYHLGDVKVTEAQYNQIISEIEAENKISAIKLVREITGWDLRKSKEYVEDTLCFEADVPAPEQAKSKGGCYIATAVYGSYNCSQVWVLRRYRDENLAKSVFGRALIRLYYAVSPTIVKRFGDAAWFAEIWRPALDALVDRCRADGYADTPYEDRAR